MCLLYCACHACHAKCICPDPLQMSHACHRFWNCYKTLTFCSLLTRCTIPCAYHAERHLNIQKRSVTLSFCTFTSKCAAFAPQRGTPFRHVNFQKWSEHGVALYILTWKRSSRHNGVHFFDITTSKNGNVTGVLCTFWLGNVLRATTACNCSSLIWPAGSAPAALASLLLATNHWKNTVFPDFPTFSRTWIFFLLTVSSLIFFLLIFSSLTLPISAFHLSILSEVWLLNLLRWTTNDKPIFTNLKPIWLMEHIKQQILCRKR